MQTGRNGCIVCKLLSVKEWRASAGEKSLRNKEGNKGRGREKKGGQGANLEYYACRFVLSKVIKTGTVHTPLCIFRCTSLRLEHLSSLEPFYNMPVPRVSYSKLRRRLQPQDHTSLWSGKHYITVVISVRADRIDAL